VKGAIVDAVMPADIVFEPDSFQYTWKGTIREQRQERWHITESTIRTIMKHLLLHSLLIVSQLTLALPELLAQRTSEASRDGVPPPARRTVVNNAFDVGEELIFDVNYGFVTAGQARMAVPSYSWQKGRKCYHLQFLVRSTSFFDRLYRVRDRYESHLDVEGLFPWRFMQQIREGNYKRDFSARFDHDARKAYTSEGVYDLPPFTQDALSAFYYMRTYDYSALRPGQKVTLQNFYKDSTYTLTVIYHRRETITVKAGTFRSIVLEPVMEEGGLFKATGRILLWVTDDERKIPIQVNAQIPIGSITSELTEANGIKGPIRARVR
jgi:hypothetical protein